ncbi:MAG: hypothetical protein AAFV54_02510 [Pseudomonadota bacterium]
MAIFKQTCLAITLATLAVSACSGGDGGTGTSDPAGSPPPTGGTPPPPGSPPPPPPTTSSATMLETPEESARFLIQASLGADIETIEANVGADATEWVSSELNKPCTGFLTPILE